MIIDTNRTICPGCVHEFDDMHRTIGCPYCNYEFPQFAVMPTIGELMESDSEFQDVALGKFLRAVLQDKARQP